VERIDHAENFFTATGADIRHGGNQGYYAIGSDRIQMQPFESLCDAESYYATLAHETTHWTRHPSRLDRDFGRKRWGDEGSAQEELVAELRAPPLNSRPAGGFEVSGTLLWEKPRHPLRSQLGREGQMIGRARRF
jgi:antirestriction protein ArdC